MGEPLVVAGGRGAATGIAARVSGAPAAGGRGTLCAGMPSREVVAAARCGGCGTERTGFAMGVTAVSSATRTGSLADLAAGLSPAGAFIFAITGLLNVRTGGTTAALPSWFPRRLSRVGSTAMRSRIGVLLNSPASLAETAIAFLATGREPVSVRS